MKFWMTMSLTVLALGTMTGCPDDTTCSDCSCDPSLCDGGNDADTSADADADADSGADADTDSDGGDTTSCPDISGDWALTYHNTASGADGNYNIHLDQDGCLVTGYDEDCNYSGSINEIGYISLYRDCATYDRTVTGNFTQPPPHMAGTWDEPDIHGTWWADPH